jgi:hypothetical protein
MSRVCLQNPHVQTSLAALAKPQTEGEAMKMLRPYSLWTTAGVALFVAAGIFFGTGRFGAGIGLMVASAVCLGAAMTSHRAWIKKNGSD